MLLQPDGTTASLSTNRSQSDSAAKAPVFLVPGSARALDYSYTERTGNIRRIVTRTVIDDDQLVILPETALQRFEDFPEMLTAVVYRYYYC